MSEKAVYLTPEGRSKLQEELRYLLEVKRPEIAERIKAAKDFGDTTDNADFEEAKNEQAFVEGRILTLEKMLSNAVMIDSTNQARDVVRLGSRVTVVDQDGTSEQYIIVGSAEVNPLEGKISNESPVGRALLGRRPGESVEVLVPAGKLRFTISEIN